ncbi:hypothetical protein UlMin_037008 [Ulmus minor]
MSCVGRVFRGCRFVLAPRPKSSSSSSPAATVEIEKKTKSGQGLFKPTPVSPALRSFLGVSESSRADAVKQNWAHIKLHNLQNPVDKREIICDNKLKRLFEGKEKVNFLEVGKLLSRHFVKTN